jgi:hypothetical protein
MLNQQNDTMSTPFYHILMVLSYIKGPIVEDWVNMIDKELEQCTDTTILATSRKQMKSFGMSSKPPLSRPGKILLARPACMIS